MELLAPDPVVFAVIYGIWVCNCSHQKPRAQKIRCVSDCISGKWSNTYKWSSPILENGALHLYMEHCICKQSTPFIVGGFLVVLTQMAPHIPGMLSGFPQQMGITAKKKKTVALTQLGLSQLQLLNQY